MALMRLIELPWAKSAFLNRPETSLDNLKPEQLPKAQNPALLKEHSVCLKGRSGLVGDLRRESVVRIQPRHLAPSQGNLSRK